MAYVQYGGKTTYIKDEDAKRYNEYYQKLRNLSSWESALRNQKTTASKIQTAAEGSKKDPIEFMTSQYADDYVLQGINTPVTPTSNVQQYGNLSTASTWQTPSIYGSMQGSYGYPGSTILPGTGLQYPTTKGNNYFNDFYKKYADMISKRSDAQLASQLAAINQAYSEAMSEYESQQRNIPQEAQELRNKVEADYYTKSLPALYAAMEAAGQRGGENITGMVGLSTGRGQSLADINQYEANQLQAIQDAINQLKAQRASAETQARAGIDASALQNLTSAMTQAAQLAQSQQQLELQAIQQALDEAYRQQQFTRDVYESDRAYSYQVSRDKVLDDQWMKQFTLQQQQQMLDEAYRNKQITLDEYQAKTARINAETARMSAVAQMSAEESTFSAKDYLNQAKAMLEQGNDKIAVFNYLLNSPLEGSVVDEIINLLGLTKEYNEYRYGLQDSERWLR